VSENNLFPRRSEIFKGSPLDVRGSVARPSLDTLYQVNFSFGKVDKWLENNLPGKKRTQGFDFKRKMSLLCTQAEIPGTNFTKTFAIGHHQGIQEEFPELRNFPPLNLTFYCDVDMVILEVLESWMTFINPIMTDRRSHGAFSRFNYPEDYKEIIHLTKFERDTFTDNQEDKSEYKSNMTSYEFVNVWPVDMTSMRLAYGDPNVLQCSVQFSYDRFFTKFDYEDSNVAVVNTFENVVNSNDQVQRIKRGQGGLPLGTTTLRSGGIMKKGNTPYNNPDTNYRNRKRGSGAR